MNPEESSIVLKLGTKRSEDHKVRVLFGDGRDSESDSLKVKFLLQLAFCRKTTERF